MVRKLSIYSFVISVIASSLVAVFYIQAGRPAIAAARSETTPVEGQAPEEKATEADETIVDQTDQSALEQIVRPIVRLFSSLKPDREPAPVLTKVYFSVDDGETFFAADASLVPPFEHDGQEAVRAHVFRCGDGEPFIGYLEKYTPEMKERIEAMLRGDEPGVFLDVQEEDMNTLVKRPGGDEWVILADDERSDEVLNIRCPDGTRDGLQRVLP